MPNALGTIKIRASNKQIPIIIPIVLLNEILFIERSSKCMPPHMAGATTTLNAAITPNTIVGIVHQNLLRTTAFACSCLLLSVSLNADSNRFKSFILAFMFRFLFARVFAFSFSCVFLAFELFELGELGEVFIIDKFAMSFYIVRTFFG